MSVFRRARARSDDANRGHGSVRILDDTTFLPATGGGRFTLVDFSATWCGPCRRFAPVFKEVAADRGDLIDFAACDVDASPETAALLQITAVPTLVLFDPRGDEVGRVIGPPPRAALEQMLDDVVERFGLLRVDETPPGQASSSTP